MGALDRTFTTLVLGSAQGIQLRVLDLGASVQCLRVPTRRGWVPVALGLARPADYLDDPHYLGATIGRYANRIRGARFRLNGRQITLQANELATGNCLHGGEYGFHRQRWRLAHGPDRRSIVCRFRSADGEGGFPGNVVTTVVYELLGPMSLAIHFHALADRDTVLSLTNHTYFNLAPADGTVDRHQVRIHASHYTPTDDRQIPIGELRAVRGTDFDLGDLTPLSTEHGPVRYDHNFAVTGASGVLRAAAEAYAPSTGLRLRVQTTQPGVQLYTGDGLSGAFHPRQGLCLETQGFPDAPNQAQFPTARLAAGEGYRHTTVYEFSQDP
ncbi:MAG: aldose epimerase family protein [Pseudomonadota bacterium]